MPTSAVLLVLASTVLHAAWNARLHRSADPEVVIDLAYLDRGHEEPELVIVDYKTDAVVDDADRIAKASRYRLQGRRMPWQPNDPPA